MRCGTTFSCLSATPGGATAGQERDERDRASERLAELLGRVACRDRDAFRSLYEATSARLYGVAIGLLHDRARAEEVLQEAYVRIWQRAAEFDATIARPMTWLISIVRHRAIDLLRAERHEREHTDALDDAERDNIVALAPSPDQQLQRALEAASIDQGLRDLPRQQRHALALALYRGMSHTEIARAADVPLGTAKAWVRRGMARLQRCLDTAPGVH
jgi:RNA polymerase sigma-70 factor (ECF subfamily)